MSDEPASQTPPPPQAAPPASQVQTDQTIRLASIVAVDMAGFSTMTEKDQRRAAKQVEALRARIEAVATANGGRIFNTAGDGFMLEFGAAGAALGAIEDLLDKRPKNQPDIRIGAHVGDVVVTVNHDLLGHGVNVAARLQALAARNSALVSGEFRSMARNSPSAVFQARGRQPLDNIEQKVQVFAILSPKARTKRFMARVGMGAAALGVAAGLVFVTPPLLDLARRAEFLHPQAGAAPAVRPKTEATSAAPAAQPAETAAAPAASSETPASLQPGQTFRDCDACPEMVALPGGKFQMGSPTSERGHYATEAPQREVTVQPFAVAKYEVRFVDWDACAAAGGCGRIFPTDRGWGRGARPVVGVSWRDAQAYVRWLNEQGNHPPYRLLSEAEWEYAARADTTGPYGLGASIARTQAVFRARQTQPVGGFQPNGFGLFDMHGNAAEWVEDCYNSTYVGAPTDGGAWTRGQCGYRVFRGGAWRDAEAALRSANRARASATLRDSRIGFRVARNLE